MRRLGLQLHCDLEHGEGGARDCTSSLEQRDLRAQVKCPSYVPQEEGHEFSCVATVGQTDTTFTVVQLDDAGHVRYEAP